MSETSLNFLSLEITISVCIKEVFFFYSCNMDLYIECVQYGSLIIIFLNSLSKRQVFIFFFLIISKNVESLNILSVPLVFTIFFPCIWRISQIWIFMTLMWFALCWFCDLEVLHSSVTCLLMLSHLAPIYFSWLIAYLNFLMPSWFNFWGHKDDCSQPIFASYNDYF